MLDKTKKITIKILVWLGDYMIKSFYKNDKRNEEMFAKWIEDNFYKNLVNNKKIKGYERAKDETLQKNGIDTILYANHKLIAVDEKTALHYINKNLSTFSFEIFNRTSKAVGWLYNDALATEYYLLAWPTSFNEIKDNVISSPSDFKNSEIMLIKKSLILKLLDENNISKALIKKLIIDNQNSGIKKIILTKDISLNFNNTLHERPVNIVINKELLKSKALVYGTYGLVN